MIRLVRFKSNSEWQRLKEELGMAGIVWWKLVLWLLSLAAVALLIVFWAMKVGATVSYGRGVDAGYELGLKHGGEYGVRLVQRTMDESVRRGTVVRFDNGDVYQVFRQRKNLYRVVRMKAREAEDAGTITYQ